MRIKGFLAVMAMSQFITAGAYAGACVPGQSGTINQIEMNNDGSHFSVSFGNNSVPVWHHFGEEAGRAQLAVINAGLIAGATLSVSACASGSISAFKISAPYSSRSNPPAGPEKK